MYVIDDKLAFICHPKTGSQSIREALRGAKVVEGMHGVDPSVCEQLRKKGIVACVVRNPWDLMISWYFYSHVNPYNIRDERPHDFEDWLPWFIENDKWIKKGLFYGAKHCNQFIRFEGSLERQINYLLEVSKMPPIKLPHNGKTNHRDYSHYYNPTTKKLVADRFCGEIERFGYLYRGC